MSMPRASGWNILAFALWGIYIVASIAIFTETPVSNARLAVGIIVGIALNLAAAWALGRFYRAQKRDD